MPQIKEGEVSLAVFREQAKSWFECIQENVDPSFIIFTYWPSNPHEANAIQCPELLDALKSITQLQQYFNNLHPTNKEGYLYLNLRVGFTEGPHNETIQDMHAVSSSLAQVYLSPLQAADMEKIGWLHPSHHAQDLNSLQDYLNTGLKNLHNGTAVLLHQGSRQSGSNSGSHLEANL